MQLKKLLQGSAFAVMVAACAIAVPSVVKAADPTGALTDAGITSVKVDGTKAQMTVGSSAKEVLVGFGKVNTKKKAITVASWDSYDMSGSTVTVDLSKLSNTKDNYIVLSTPGKDVSIVKIPAVAKATKAKYDAGKGELLVASGDKVTNSDLKAIAEGASGAAGTVDLYEYRTVYSDWANVKDDLWDATGKKSDLSLYQNEGAKLIVRLKGVAETSFPTTQKADEAYEWAETGTKAQVYQTTSTLPGKEAKVTIPAKAKGPKAVADYTKGTIKFPKNSEYRLVDSTALQAAKDGKYTDGPTTATALADVAKADSAIGAKATFDVEVRTKATDKKGASKWSRLAVTMPAQLSKASPSLLTAGTTQEGKTNGNLPAQDTSEHKGGNKGIKDAVVKEDSSVATSVLAINYVAVKLDASKFYTANAIEIQNNGKKTYEVVVTANKDTAPAADAKATKIAPTKKVVLTKVADGAGVWIRVAGDKKTMTWLGAYDNLGLVDYPFTVPAKAASTP